MRRPGWSSPTRSGLSPGRRRRRHPLAGVLAAGRHRRGRRAARGGRRPAGVGAVGDDDATLRLRGHRGRRRACRGPRPARCAPGRPWPARPSTPTARPLTFVLLAEGFPPDLRGNAARAGRVGPDRGHTDQVRLPLTAARREAGTCVAYVDWEFAKTTGRLLVPAGPTVTRAEAEAEVAADPRRRPRRASSRSPRRALHTPATTRPTPWSSTAPPGSRSTPTR